MVPLVAAELCVKGALLQPLKLEAKLRADLLQAGTRSVLLENIPMAAEENKITLVMPSNNLATNKVRLYGEKRGEQTANIMAKARVEIIHNYFRKVVRGTRMVLPIL